MGPFNIEVVGDLAGDPRDQRRTRFQFRRASYLLAQVSKNHDPETLQKLQEIKIGMQLWMKNIVP